MSRASKIRKLKVIISFLLIYQIPAANTLLAQNYDSQYSQTTYGGVGLIETPTARFADDGELLFGVSSEDIFNRVFFKMQFLPWMETVLRYTEGTFSEYQPGIPQTWKDKGLDAKFRLYQNNQAGLSLAMGLTDIGGTGFYSSEYIVMSKATNSIDYSLGIGWGYLAGTGNINNFIGYLDSERDIRGGASRYGGKINLKRFFSGDKASIFGGLEYFTPIKNLSLKVEYDPSDYSVPTGVRKKFFCKVNCEKFYVDSRTNYALNYRIDVSDRENIDLSLGYIRGNTIYANIAVHSNLNYSGSPRISIGGEKIRNTNMPGIDSYSTLDKNRQKFLYKRTVEEMARIGFVTHAIKYNDDEIAAEISQSRFPKTTQAIDLASRVLANNSPRNIKKITVINIDNGIETMRSTVARSDLIESVKLGPLEEDLIVFNEYHQDSADSIYIENESLYPNFYYEVKPHINNTIQHQIRFFFWQLEALAHTVLSIKKGLYLTTDIGIDIANNFDEYTYHVPDGQLHHVRQDRRLYLTEGESGIRRMALDYYVDLSQNLKAQLSAGYLEWMYGGIGGELLYIPDNKRWAVGIDAYWVKQREFDQKFSFRDYETAIGFLSYYRDIPFYDMRLKLSAGKFLGKDVGAMFDVSRRFKSGARVGAFAAFTDCDTDCVGEGSFHKGIYFELPMDLFYVQSTTRNKAGYSWAPLTKDAAAKIARVELYEVMTDAPDDVNEIRQKSWSISKIISGFGTSPKIKL